MKWMVFLICCLACTTMNANTVIIGTSAGNPPLSYQVDDKNHFYGFEVEVMNEICKRMHDQCEFKGMLVSNLLDELRSGKINLAIAAIILPDKIPDEFIFSLPYLQSGAIFLTLKSSKINYPIDIKGKIVGVRRGTLNGGNLFKDLILTIYNNKITVKDYPTMHDLLLALSNNEVDVIFSNELPLQYWYHQNEGVYKLVGSEIPVGNNYAIIAGKQYKNEIGRINQALLDMIGDGTYLKIYRHYFGFLLHENH